MVQLFTVLGLDTGFTTPNCNAGMELDSRHADAPYIVKSPWLCDYLDEVLESERCIIDHAIIPVRDLYSAAESRRETTRRARMMIGVEEEVPGGLWHTKTPEQQESILTLELYKIIHVISKRDIPIALLCFPRLVADPEYLFRKLEFMLNGIGYHGFLAAFKQTARPELVHDFGTSEETNAEKNG